MTTLDDWSPISGREARNFFFHYHIKNGQCCRKKISTLGITFSIQCSNPPHLMFLISTLFHNMKGSEDYSFGI
jgi:hypothetical protein